MNMIGQVRNWLDSLSATRKVDTQIRLYFNIEYKNRGDAEYAYYLSNIR